MKRILFAGTPDICVPLLKALASRNLVAAVLTNCDKPQGRSKTPVPSPAKVAATELGLEVLQFDSLKTEARQAVRATGADVLVSFAFGKIFGPMFLDLFKGGTFNVHPSDLPVLRGPSPVQSAIAMGLRTQTVSVQKIGLKMDEGDIYAKKSFALTGRETTLSLEEQVALIAAEFVPDVINDALEGKIKPVVQSGQPTYCTMIDKSQAVLDFNKTASEVHAKIRAMYPWPKASATVNSGDIFITSVWGGFEDLDNEPLLENVKPGTVVGFRKDRGIGIACSDKAVWVTGLQLPGKKELDFKSFANGNSWFLKAVLNETL